MERKTIIYLTVIGVTALLILSGVFGNLYFTQTQVDTEYSASSHIKQNYQPEKWGAKVGIYFKNLKQTTLLAEKLAFYLREYLQQSGYQQVEFIQQGQLPGEPELDLLISCNFAVSTSPLPLIKRGKLKSNFTVQSFTLWPEVMTTKRFTFDYQSKETVTAEGFISQQAIYHLLLQQTAKRFVTKLNEEANSRFNLSLQEEFSAPLAGKKVDLRVNNNNKLSRQYSAWIPKDSRQVDISKYGQWTLISFVTQRSRQTLNNLLPADYEVTTESWRLEKNIKTGQYDNARKKLYLQVTDKRNYKQVQLVLWDYGPCLEVLQDYKEYRAENEGHVEELKNRLKDQPRSFFYYLANLKLLEQQIKEGYWLEGQLKSNLIEECLRLIGELKLAAYPGADDFYRGDLYQQLGILTRRSDYLARAVEEYQRIISNYGRQKFGLGAKKRILQIKANPIYKQHNYQRVLNQLETSQVDNLDLAITKAEVLFKQGRYQEALAKLQGTTYENRELAVITRAKLGKQETNLGKLRNYDLRQEIKKRMVLIYNYYLRGREEIAAKIAEDLKLNYPLWMIKEEVDEFYRQTGIELDVF